MDLCKRDSSLCVVCPNTFFFCLIKRARHLIQMHWAVVGTNFPVGCHYTDSEEEGTTAQQLLKKQCRKRAFKKKKKKKKNVVLSGSFRGCLSHMWFIHQVCFHCIFYFNLSREWKHYLPYFDIFGTYCRYLLTDKYNKACVLWIKQHSIEADSLLEGTDLLMWAHCSGSCFLDI